MAPTPWAGCGGPNRVALFLSTYINRVDSKGRVSVPAPFRAALQGQSLAGIVVFPSIKVPALDGGGMDQLEALNARISNLDEFSEERDAISSIFADAQALPFDSEGRVVLPPYLAEHAGITETAAFVGAGNSFQIWDPEQYKRHHAERRSRARSVTLPALPARMETGR